MNKEYKIEDFNQEQLKEMQVENRKMFSVDNGIIKTLD